MTRRMRRSLSLVAVCAVALTAASGPLHAQNRLPPPPRTTQVPDDDLKIVYLAGRKAGADAMFSSFYLIVGGVNDRHTLALELDDGVILVDTKPPKFGKRLGEKVGLATANPITKIINSNPGGAVTNSAFPDVVDIYAHENTKARLEKLEAFKGANARFLPTKTFKDTLSVPLNTVGEASGTNRVDMYHFGPAHSDGDLVAVFPSFGVAYLGELFPEKGVPTIDIANGGSALAFPDTLARAVEGLKDAGVQTIVPAHAPAPYKAVVAWLRMGDLQEYAEFTRAFVDAVKAAKGAGKSVDDAVAGLQLPAKFKNYGMANARANVQAIYDELAR